MGKNKKKKNGDQFNSEDFISPYKVDISSESKGLLNPIYAQRNIKIYAIPENELNIISSLNNQTTIFYSAFTLFFGVGLTLFLSGVYADNLQNNLLGKVLFQWGTPLMGIIALFCLILAGLAQWSKSNIIKNIKKESISLS